MYLEKINSPEDVKKLNIEEMKVLAQEIRDAVIKRDAIHGGHFGPNLGMVEATIALHYVFDSPKDKFVFDVSHQTYPHKILTGRREAFTDEAHYDDVTGYSNQHESEHDHFILGHTSTSISLALGLAKARDVKGEKGNVIVSVLLLSMFWYLFQHFSCLYKIACYSIKHSIYITTTSWSAIKFGKFHIFVYCNR